MPTLIGWEFMAEYEKFNEIIKQQIRVYNVSSSVDDRDKDKAKANNLIMEFLSQPLQMQTILSLAEA